MPIASPPPQPNNAQPGAGQPATAQPGRIRGRAAVPGPADRVSARARIVAGAPVAHPVPGGGEYRGGVYGDGMPQRRRGPRWGRIALVLVLGLVLLVGCVSLGGYLYARDLNKDLARTDPFSAITGNRPAKLVSGSLNILLLGSDSRDPSNKSGDDNGPARTDTIIVMHIPASHDRAYLVSIPRDLYVYVPKSPTSEFGDTRAKINAAFAWGGAALMVQTIEGFTGLHIDHVMIIDFAGFKEVTDALGGVDLYVERDITSIHQPYRKFTKGTHHFNGEEALDYVRQRYQFPDGDFARVRHQQEFLKALMDKATSTGTLSNPTKLNNFLKAATKAITVDQNFSLIDMALQFRNLRSDKLTFLTSPHSGTATIDGQSVVLSDREKASELYNAMARDAMAEWVATHPQGSPKPAG